MLSNLRATFPGTTIFTRNLVHHAASRAPSKTQPRPRVVILGSGWAGNTLARRLDKKIYDVRLISPANHFLFTPLLPSTAVGTLEFRAIQEPIRTIKGLGEYYQAKARKIDTEKRVVRCEDLFKGHSFEVKYDYLCIAAGNKTNTFQTPGVAEHEGESVFFLKHLHHARQIRNRVLECFERATNPNICKLERSRLLSFIVVGGGPTSCEFIMELYDFLNQDVSKWYPDLIDDIQLTLVEAGPGLLGTFDKALASYYLEKLIDKKINVRLSTAVVAVKDKHLDQQLVTDIGLIGQENHDYTVATLADGEEIPFGTMVWSAGLSPVKLVQNSSSCLKLSRSRVVVDKYLRVPGQKGRIFAIGDCATPVERALPPTASVAEQQGYYIGDCLNLHYSNFDVLDKNNHEKDVPLPGPVAPALWPYERMEFLNKIMCTPMPEFQYKNRGSLAAMGFGGGVADLSETDLPFPKAKLSGLAAFIMWRATYMTKQLSWSNMILIPMYWFKAMVFGRDISRF